MSRQTISKWEGSQSVPDFKRMIQLYELFGVTTDYLLKDSIEIAEHTTSEKVLDSEPSLRKVSLETANKYLIATDSASRKHCAGVMLCILSPIMLILMNALYESKTTSLTENQVNGIGLLCLISLIGIAVAFFLQKKLILKPFDYITSESIGTDYGVEGMVKDRRKKYRNTYNKQYIAGIIAGIIACVISAIPIFASLIYSEEDITMMIAVCFTLIIVAIGVMLILRSSMILNSYNALLEDGKYTRKKIILGACFYIYTGYLSLHFI